MKQKEILADALKEFSTVNPLTALKQFNFYYQELLAWNKKINLISRHDEKRIVTRHFLESLGILKAIHFPPHSRVLDLGSGAGLPGIPVAIVRPDIHILLIEAKKKKAEFLEQISRKLSLENVQVIDKRVEEICENIQPVNIVISRGVSTLQNLYKWSHKCLEKTRGRLVTVKGEQYKEEIQRLLIKSKSDTPIEYTIEPYDPFPHLYFIRKCYLVIIKEKRRN